MLVMFDMTTDNKSSQSFILKTQQVTCSLDNVYAVFHMLSWNNTITTTTSTENIATEPPIMLQHKTIQCYLFTKV